MTDRIAALTVPIWLSSMAEKPYCEDCGRATVGYWKSWAGYNAATGERNGRWATRCPRWRWWRPFHTKEGWVLSPPPKDRG